MDLNFEQLYKTHYMNVYSFVMTLAKKPDIAEEITQQAFFKAMTTSKKHLGNSSEFTWLCAIAKNLFLEDTQVRQRYVEEPERERAVSINIERAFADEDTAFRIHQVLHTLEEPYKEVFGLRVFSELSFKKIGLLFGKTENWACVTYHRARAKIQERSKLE